MATPLPLIAGLGTPELLIILVVVLLLFGAAKLPELARGSGRALRIFKAETKGLMDDDDDETTTPVATRAVPPATTTTAAAAATEQDRIDQRQADLDRMQAELNAERDKHPDTGV